MTCHSCGLSHYLTKLRIMCHAQDYSKSKVSLYVPISILMKHFISRERNLSHNVVSGSDTTSCNKIDKPLFLHIYKDKTFSYSYFDPLSNGRKSMFKSGDSQAV